MASHASGHSTHAEIAALVETLRVTEQRLDEITAGEVDSVFDRYGRSFLLRTAQESLLDNEAIKQEAILNALPASIALLDAQGVIVSVNEAWSAFGRAYPQQFADAPVGANYFDVCAHVNGEAQLIAAIENGLRDVLCGVAPTFVVEYPCHAPNEQRWFRMTMTPYSIGLAGGAVVMHIDVSEMRRNEASSRQSADLLKAVAEGTPEIIFLKDAEGRYRFCNEAMLRFLERSMERVIGRSDAQLFDADDCASFTERDRSVIVDGQSVSIETTLGARSAERTFLMTKTPHRDELGQVIGLIGIARDITERKKADLQRERERQFLRTLLDAIPDAVYSKDTGGRYVICNRATLAMFGFESEPDMAGKTASELLPEDVAAMVHIDDMRALGGESVLDRETLVKGANGTSRWFSRIKVPMLDRAGNVAGLVGISRDITARKDAERELRESQSLLSIAGRLAQVGGWAVDLPAERVIWSDALAAIHDEPSGRSPSTEEALAYYVPEHRERMRETFERCASLGTPFDVEYELATAQGRRIWVRAIGEAVLGDDGTIRRVQGALQDLSERKRAEQEARHLATRMTNILESITDGFFTIDRAWRYTYLNSQAEQMLQASRDELIGRSLWDVYPASLGTIFEDSFRRAMAGETGISFEALYAPSASWLSVDCYPSDEGLSIYVRDVGVKRAARLRLELLEASVSQLNDIVMITEWSPSAHPGPRILFVNEAFERITGHAREDVLGRSPDLLHGPLTDKGKQKRIEQAVLRREPIHCEILNYKNDGETFWAEYDALPVGAADASCTHYVIVQRDISERRRDQDALRQLNAELEGRVTERTAELDLARIDAEQANRAKSTFLATMSHEIRTPMNGVIGMIDVLHQTSLKGYQVEMVDLIRDSADSLLKIIEDILDFSKIEAGKLDIAREPLNLSELIEKVCGMLDHMAGKLGVDLSAFVDPLIPPMMFGDETRIRQVLVNLTSNAIKFSSGREIAGRVVMRATLVEHRDDQVSIEMSVSDNGIGMDESTLSSLFTPFTQADVSTARRFGGTGLGLAISSMLVQLMGGDIRAASVVAQGSTLSVRLQLTEIRRAPGSEDAIAPAHAKAFHCRIVGSEMPLGDDLDAYLRYSGIAVERAPDLVAAAAAPRAPGLCLWLILPDQMPPALEGLRALSPRTPQAETRFIVLGRGKRRRPRVEAFDLVSIDANVLFRPMLLTMLATATGTLRHEEQDASADGRIDFVRAPPREVARRHRRLILVAEDNETNRKVIMQQLPLAGFAAEVTVNGREALERWRSGDYALIITDLHMPVMDGYELAAAIRSEEGGGRRTPIIALTANVQRDEELRCREAGMDGYLSKPVRIPQLRSMIELWLGAPAAVADAAPAHADIAIVAAPANPAVLAALIGNDPAAILEIMQSFCHGSAEASAAIRDALALGRMQPIVDATHKLKSGAHSIGATRLADLCEQIEQAAQLGPSVHLQQLVDRFEGEREALNEFVRAM